MEKKLKEKGITLIALIITIIVLLILAGVTISMLTEEDGLLSRATSAVDKTKYAKAEEDVRLAAYASFINSAKINKAKFIKNLNNIEGIDPITDIPESHKVIINGIEIDLEEYIGYLDEVVPLIDKVNIGDYVAYDATNNYSYTSEVGTGSSHGNGYTNLPDGQTFTSSSNIKWKVLSKDTSSGEIVLISELPIKTDEGNQFYIHSAIGYLYGEEELNRICSIYGHGVGANTSKIFTCEIGDGAEGKDTISLTGSGARSINEEDINTICGVTPSSQLHYMYGAEYIHEIYYPSRETNNGKSSSAISRKDVFRYYSYYGSNYLETNQEPYITLFKQLLYKTPSESVYNEYWVASRTIASYSDHAAFYVHYVADETMQARPLSDFGKNGVTDSSAFCCSVRPLVYLKADVFTTGKDSNDAWKVNS